MERQRNWYLHEAGRKRELAAALRQTAGVITLKQDRDSLLAQAAALEAEAERLELQSKG